MRVKRKLILLVALINVIFLLGGCDQKSEGILLRYSPQVGSTYPYNFKINQSLAPIEMPVEMQVLSKDENGYQIQFSGVLNELFAGLLIVTEHHNSDHPGYISLNFPDDPVEPGTEWVGEVPWYYENYYVLDPTELVLPASYKLLAIDQGENGTYVVIEQRIEADVAIDGLVFYIGQVGVRWDREGKITEVHQDYDAYGKLEIGDVVIGINGQRAEGEDELRLMAEEYIQHPKQSKLVMFTVLRGDNEQDIEVEKSIDQFAVVKVYNKRDVIDITYDIERGILVSVAVSSSYDVAYESPSADPFPVVDDYGGFHKFGYLNGMPTYQEHIDSNGVAWTLSLIE